MLEVGGQTLIDSDCGWEPPPGGLPGVSRCQVYQNTDGEPVHSGLGCLIHPADGCGQKPPPGGLPPIGVLLPLRAKAKGLKPRPPELHTGTQGYESITQPAHHSVNDVPRLNVLFCAMGAAFLTHGVAGCPQMPDAALDDYAHASDRLSCALGPVPVPAPATVAGVTPNMERSIAYRVLAGFWPERRKPAVSELRFDGAGTRPARQHGWVFECGFMQFHVRIHPLWLHHHPRLLRDMLLQRRGSLSHPAPEHEWKHEHFSHLRDDTRQACEGQERNGAHLRCRWCASGAVPIWRCCAPLVAPVPPRSTTATAPPCPTSGCGKGT